MRALVVLAVVGVCSASYQAYSPGYSYGVPVQPRYTGALASSVPAGVGGKIIPVSDTYEVAAARDAFFRQYNDQLNTINSIRTGRYGTPGYGHPAPVYGPSGAAHGPVHGPFHGPVHGPVHGPAHGSVHGPVHRPVHAPASSYGAPSHRYSGAPSPVRDTPEVAAAKVQFHKLFQQQAAAAAAAPDHYTHH